MVCAGGARKSCKGDSGGPLTCSRDLTNGQQELYLCGIVSWGVTECYNENYPSVYTDVTKYEKWIRRSWCKINSYVTQEDNRFYCDLHFFNFSYTAPCLLRHGERIRYSSLFGVNIG